MTTAVAATPTETVLRVPRTQLIPCPLNPRTRFDEAALQELGASLREKGVIQPLLVRVGKKNGAQYEIVDGERRWRAATLASVDELPVISRPLSDSDVLEIAIVSAVQRQGLTPLEEAAGYRRLIDSNPSHYSARYIADRIGRHEKYVWDRMKLLDLVDAAKALLDDERILVGHAELLAKLKPEDQRRAIGFEDDEVCLDLGGLFEASGERDLFVEDEDDDLAARDPFHGMKVRTVRELEAWIAKHVRFDVEHFAHAAPLDFGPVSDRVAEASAKPGRGKKVISITHEYHIDDAAKADGERTYGPRSWRRADGEKGSSPCEYGVLGVVAVGPEYGQAFNVCIARDRCDVHWKDEIAAKKKSADLRDEGKAKQAAKREEQAEAQRKREEQRRAECAKAWKALVPHLRAEAIAQVKGAKVLTSTQARVFENSRFFDGFRRAKQLLGPTWFKTPAAALLVLAVVPGEFVAWDVKDPFADYVSKTAKPLGLDIKRLEAVRDKHSPKTDAPAGKAKKAPATTKKARKRHG